MSRPSSSSSLLTRRPNDGLDRVPEDERRHQRVDADGDDALELGDEQRHAAAVEQPVAGRRARDLVHREQADAERAEDAVEQVDRHGADRIVDLQRVQQLTRRTTTIRPASNADDERRP